MLNFLQAKTTEFTPIWIITITVNIPASSCLFQGWKKLLKMLILYDTIPNAKGTKSKTHIEKGTAVTSAMVISNSLF